MIKNIIFDMGGVLVDFCPEKTAWRFTENPQDGELLLKELFNGPEWLQLDEGIIEEPQALASVCARLPQRLHEACRLALQHWHEDMPPKPEVCRLAARLKDQGLGLYLCSNASMRFFAYQDSIPVFQYFDGLLVSAQERCMKPHPPIYRRLFERFSLIPEECFFIDDRPENIQGGQSMGMDGYVFNGDTQKLERFFVKMGLL